MNDIIIYSPKSSARLQYVLDWLLKDVLRVGFRLVHVDADLKDLPFFISYGPVFPNALTIPDNGLLWQMGISEQPVNTGTWKGIPTIFSINDPKYSLPFDLFSAIFYLLSRYEEYYPFTPDKYERYPATESVLYKNNWLQQPIVDEWLAAFRSILKEEFNVNTNPATFTYRPTYDIDIAWSYRNKGVLRNAGGLLRDLLKGKTDLVAARTRVLREKEKDPFDSFEWLASLHERTNRNPTYFVLAALKATPYDKNISPQHPQMQELIKSLAAEGRVGMHPSFYSENDPVLQNEKAVLQNACGKGIGISRQHYIKMQLPQTYQRLIRCGIREDYSMGYGTHLGFRAGTGRSFYWYDLVSEKQTELRVYPFCFMDTTARFDEKLSAEQAFRILNTMKELLEKTNSNLVTIFHNFSLGTDKEWSGWKEIYQQFVEDASTL